MTINPGPPPTLINRLSFAISQRFHVKDRVKTIESEQEKAEAKKQTVTGGLFGGQRNVTEMPPEKQLNLRAEGRMVNGVFQIGHQRGRQPLLSKVYSVLSSLRLSVFPATEGPEGRYYQGSKIEALQDNNNYHQLHDNGIQRVTKIKVELRQPTSNAPNARLQAPTQDDSLFAMVLAGDGRKALSVLGSRFMIAVRSVGQGIDWLGSKIAGLLGRGNADFKLGPIQDAVQVKIDEQ